MTRLRSSVIALSLLFLSSTAVAEFVGELVPTYSTFYSDLKLLSTKGSVPPVPLNVRPLTREQIAAVLAEGMRRDDTKLLDDPVGLRLVREFSKELEDLGIRVPVKRHDPCWQIDLASCEPRAHGSERSSHGIRAAGHASEHSAMWAAQRFCSPAQSRRGSGDRAGPPSADSGVALLKLSPYVWVRLDNVEPIYFEALADRRLGLEGTLSVGSGALVLHADLIAGSHSDEPRGIPNFGTQNALIQGEDINSWLNRGYVRLHTKIADALFARDWIRWGPGHTGVLGAGDASTALNLLMLRRRLTRLDLASYVAVLDFADEQMVAGHRVEYRAAEGLTIGLAEQVRFRTIQQAPLYLLAFYPYSLNEKIVDVDSDEGESTWRNNVMWTADFDWIAARDTRLYGEFLLDDWSFSTDRKPTQIGYQVGFARTRPAGIERLSINAEFTKIHRYTYSQARRAQDGEGDRSIEELDFVFHGRSLGHPLGPDSEGYFVGVRYDASVRSRWDLSWEMRRRGELRLGKGWTYGDPVPATFPLSGVVETSSRIVAQYTFYSEKWIGSWVSLGGGLRKIGNVDNRQGLDKDWDGIMQASAAFQW